MSTTMIFSYNIKPYAKTEYQEWVNKLRHTLPSYDATLLSIHVEDDNKCIEEINLPTASHFHMLKKWRTEKKHSIFTQLEKWIEPDSIVCYCISQSKNSIPVFNDRKHLRRAPIVSRKFTTPRELSSI
ncbi:hypothetical protein [Mangrovibacillus cuniculi]|uniref:Uncharacterized protein n=1 Tax=Mangrovibacillus cuniculi TaxID=2593652 RepID=A0A7S8C9A6_9BACI|nr:hypothetical protein [Mangrovibacillus cuniculi]QPC45780.1 hypothetical protein G8O30_01720 [Mangrovibacillus cuniculi]